MMTLFFSHPFYSRRALFVKKRLLAFWLLSLIGLFSQPVYAAEIPAPFAQKFKATLAGFKLSAQRTLRKLDNDQYEFSVVAKNLVARYTEKSTFRVDSNGDIFPLSHSVKSKIFGVARTEQTAFNWETGLATYRKKDTIRSIDIQPGVLDRTLYQLLLPADLAAGNLEPSYAFIDRGRLKTYQFTVLAEEEVELADTSVSALKLTRVQESKKRQTLIWIAPEHNYEVVKISHLDEEGSDYKLVLRGQPAASTSTASK